MTIIERWNIRERIDDLGYVRRILSEQSDQNQADRNAGYDSSLSHAIKRLDQAISFLWNLDGSPKRDQAAGTMTHTKTSPTTAKQRYEARQQARCRRAYARGRAAARRGKPEKAYPYQITDPASVSWLAGYRGTAVTWEGA
jgi:hypothetical protein